MSSSRSSSASAVPPSTSSDRSVASQWHQLPTDLLLLLVIDSVPSYRLLLPLSSTCRRLYELIHEGQVPGGLHEASPPAPPAGRVSCWHRHPTVRLVLTSRFIVVDDASFTLSGSRGSSFVQHVVSSLRSVPCLWLHYSSDDAPPAVFLRPLRRFTRLR